MARAVINLRGFEIDGNILDISFKGSFIIPEIIETYKENKIDREFLEGEDEIACTTAIYNSAVAILSFNTLLGKKSLSKLLTDIKGSLSKEGKLVICDLNVKRFSLPKIYTIMLKLPGEKLMKMKYTLGINPFRPTFKDVVEVSEQCGFKVAKKRVDKGVYYIECLKAQEAENEDNTSVT